MKLLKSFLIVSLTSITFLASAMKKRTADDAQLTTQDSIPAAVASSSSSLAPAPSFNIEGLISDLDAIIVKIKTGKEKKRKPHIVVDIKVIQKLLIDTQNLNAEHRCQHSIAGKLPLLLHALSLTFRSHAYYDVAKVLLEHGADPNIQSANWLSTPLCLVTSCLNKHDLEITKLLLARGARVNDVFSAKPIPNDQYKKTPLKVAVEQLNNIHPSRYVDPNKRAEYDQWQQQKTVKIRGYKQEVIRLLKEAGGHE